MRTARLTTRSERFPTTFKGVREWMGNCELPTAAVSPSKPILSLYRLENDSVSPQILNSLLKNYFFCHPEHSEGPALPDAPLKTKQMLQPGKSRRASKRQLPDIFQQTVNGQLPSDSRLQCLLAIQRRSSRLDRHVPECERSAHAEGIGTSRSEPYLKHRKRSNEEGTALIERS